MFNLYIFTPLSSAAYAKGTSLRIGEAGISKPGQEISSIIIIY